MSSYELKGRIKAIFETEQKTEKFKSREFVLETDGDYPQMIKFQITQDKCSLLDKFAEGQEVEVSFNLRGREWNGKYFTNLEAWKVFGVESEVAPEPAKDVFLQELEDDLPY